MMKKEPANKLGKTELNLHERNGMVFLAAMATQRARMDNPDHQALFRDWEAVGVDMRAVGIIEDPIDVALQNIRLSKLLSAAKKRKSQSA
jgi:hypothetical protein